MVPDMAIEKLRMILRGLPPAGRIEWIMEMVATEENVRCPACSGCGTVKRPKEPTISREQAVKLMEAI